MQIVGLDVGTKRIGVAKADTSVRIAIPDGTVVVNGGEFGEIASILKRYKTNWVILGLPRNSRGEETAQSAYVRDFAKKLRRAVPTVKIRFQDESLTSVEAEKRLRARKGYFYAKGEVDAEAASIILQDFIESFAITAQMDANQSDEPNIDLEDKKDGSDRLEMPKKAPKTPQNIQKAQNIAPKAPQASKAPKTPLKRPKTPEIPSKRPKTPEIPQNPQKTKEKRQMAKKISIFTGITLAVVVAIGVGLFTWYEANIAPIYPDVNCAENPDQSACPEIIFAVQSGETTAQIANNLESANLIRSSLAAQIYYRLHFNSTDSPLKTGEYKFNRTLSTGEILDQLVKGENHSNVFSFTILPGETVAKVKARLITDYGYSAEEVNAAFSKNYDFPMLKSRRSTAAYGAEPLEGFLFGDTYEFYKGESVDKIISTSLAAMQSVIDDNKLEEKFAEHNLNLYEGITLASIVQREATASEQANVAKVFLNRLAKGMTLGSDVTTQYALDLVDPGRTTYTNNAAALSVDSLYNTRIYSGLTPGPISNPGTSALLAVANPTNTTAIYFLTGDDGMMYYSNTEEGHNQNIRAHCRNLCNVSL